MRNLSFLLLAFFLLMLSFDAVAQKRTGWQPDLKASARYKTMAIELLRNKANFNFSTFRLFYSASDVYAPIGDDIKDRMIELAYTIQTSEDQTAANDAMFEYQQLVTAHLAHIGIVSLALSFSRDDARFGDPAFLYNIQQGLLNDVVKSGDGKTLMGAYDVVTVDEEVMLISQLKLGRVISNDRHQGAVYYTMHDYVDQETGAGKTVFVNTTLPMKYLAAQQQAEPAEIFP